MEKEVSYLMPQTTKLKEHNMYVYIYMYSYILAEWSVDVALQAVSSSLKSSKNSQGNDRQLSPY